MRGSVIARAVLVVVAVAAVVVLVAFQRSEDSCTDSAKGLLFALRDRVPGPQLDATIDSFEDDCEGSSRLVDGGGVLLQEGHPGRAAGVFREAVTREPDAFSGWAGLALALRRSDPAAAAKAAEHAERLNRYYRPRS